MSSPSSRLFYVIEKCVGMERGKRAEKLRKILKKNKNRRLLSNYLVEKHFNSKKSYNFAAVYIQIKYKGKNTKNEVIEGGNLDIGNDKSIN